MLEEGDTLTVLEEVGETLTVLEEGGETFTVLERGTVQCDACVGEGKCTNIHAVAGHLKLSIQEDY